MITLILDGYNVIYAIPSLAKELDRSLEAARTALIRLCEAYRARRGDLGQVYVVFDGRGDGEAGAHGRQGGVTVVFTHKPEEADQRILRVIEAERGRGPCVVVSNDNEVANNARAFGARIVSAQEFYRAAGQVTTPGRQPPADPGKATPSARDAQRITEEYRKHLEGR
ncbi:MAG: hypothetical protein COV75_04745 [Candidatus Omnitrophica bacterium CG11_big_fil_rev_8_21_14_0_20_63_9]|nr:MAG: hypothetical protein COV75_04745 [Candidatus Omnitrophica bacterium CG11_big_fil_rev_8_21_14_0_20_63_9]